jgi:hypothetical protein
LSTLFAIFLGFYRHSERVWYGSYNIVAGY